MARTDGRGGRDAPEKGAASAGETPQEWGGNSFGTPRPGGAPDEARAPRSDSGDMRLRDLVGLLAGQRPFVLLVAVLSLAVAAASLLQPLVVNDVIARVQAGEGLQGLVWLLGGLVLLSGALSAFQQYFLQRMGETVVLRARLRLVGRLFRLPVPEYDRRPTGDLVSRLSSDTTLLRSALIQGLVAALSGGVTFLGALIAMAFLDLPLLAITLGVVVVSVAVVTALGAAIQRASNEAQAVMGRLTSSVERTLNAIRTVRAANATARQEAELAEHAQASWRAGIRLAKIAAVVSPVSGISTQVSFLAVVGVGGYRVASGSLSIADLVTFILFLFMMIMPLSQAFEAITSVNQALGAYSRIHEVDSIPSEDADDASLPAVPAARDTTIRLELRDVSFAYPAAGDPDEEMPLVLDDISLSVPRGGRIALVGPSGSGKSSILQLMERFYEPTSGALLLDGHDVREIPRGDLRSLIGYVEQDAPVLSGTLRTNLTLGAPAASGERCRAVLDAVNLGSLVDRSPDGLDATVGENGVALSGGEKQRLAIARALIAEPPILLLDESTSSLDSRNEQHMRSAINAVAEGRTLVVVAHRLSTVMDSDLIVVLDQGRIVGRGTHTELLETTPLYRELAEYQLLAGSRGGASTR